MLDDVLLFTPMVNGRWEQKWLVRIKRIFYYFLEVAPWRAASYSNGHDSYSNENVAIGNTVRKCRPNNPITNTTILIVPPVKHSIQVSLVVVVVNAYVRKFRKAGMIVTPHLSAPTLWSPSCPATYTASKHDGHLHMPC